MLTRRILLVPMMLLMLAGPAYATRPLGLAWDHSPDVSNIEFYVVERSLDNGATWVELQKIPVAASSFTYQTTEVGQMHWYRLYALPTPQAVLQGFTRSAYSFIAGSTTETVLKVQVPPDAIALQPGLNFRGGNQ